MAGKPWHTRVARAELLAEQYPFAREILRFYVHVLHFQQLLHGELAGEIPHVSSTSLASPSEVALLVSRFGAFLTLAEKQGPPSLRTVAAELNTQGSYSWSDVLSSVWTNLDGSDSSSVQLLAKAFLQPYAEFLRTRVALR